jgi:acetyl esterase/lipase
VLTSLLFQADGRSLLLALEGPRAPGRLWTVEVAAPGGYRCLLAPERCRPDTDSVAGAGASAGLVVVPTQPAAPSADPPDAADLAGPAEPAGPAGAAGARVVPMPFPVTAGADGGVAGPDVPTPPVPLVPAPVVPPRFVPPPLGPVPLGPVPSPESAPVRTAPIMAVTAEPVRPVPVRFPGADGLPLTGLLYRPAGARAPMPMMLHFHGGPESQERPTYNPLFQALAAAGVAVFAPNVRGSSGYGRAFTEADDLDRRWAALADVEACARYAVAAGLADPDRLGCMGRSYGGYLTLAALTRFPDLFRVGVDVCGMFDLATFYERTEPWIAASAVTKYGHPVEHAQLLRELSPAARADRLRTPLLVVHGVNDTNVPFFEGEQAMAAAMAAGVPARFLRFDGEGHEALRRDNRTLFVRETLRWIGEHLLGVGITDSLPEAV